MTAGRVAWFAICSCCVYGSPQTSGQLVDAITCQGIRNVRILGIIPESPGKPASTAETRTDQDGKFVLPERYSSVSYERDGYRLYSNAAPWKSQCPPGSTLMMPLAVLEGEVVDEDRRPIADALVVAESFKGPGKPWRSPVQLRSDQKGRFSLQLDPFDTHLTITDPRCRSAGLLPGNPPRRRVSLYQTIHLAPGERRSVQFQLLPAQAYKITGTIKNRVLPFKNGVIEMRLDARRSEALFCPSFLEYINQPGGPFAIEGIPPGKYRFYISLQRHVPGCDYCSPDPVYAVYREIEVKDNDITQVQVDIFPGAQLTGTIHWEGKTPPLSYWPSVAVLGQSGNYYDEIRENQMTAFRMSRVQPGMYRLVVSRVHPDFKLRQIELNGKAIPADALEITAEMPSAKLDLYFTATSAQ